MDKMNKAVQISEFLFAFYLGSVVLEEYRKAFLILENWDKERITIKLWKKKFTKHHPKLRHILKVK